MLWSCWNMIALGVQLERWSFWYKSLQLLNYSPRPTKTTTAKKENSVASKEKGAGEKTDDSSQKEEVNDTPRYKAACLDYCRKAGVL